MIEILNLTKSFKKKTVLKNISFTIRGGTITGIAGPNGCGKSTLIKSILNLVLPDSGDIKIDGNLINHSAEYKRKIAYVPQSPRFPQHLSLMQIMELLEDLRKEKASKKEELLSYFGLQSITAQSASEFSGGTKQKAAALLAFMFDPPVLICDEPTAGLDPFSSIEFRKLLITGAQRGKTIVFVSHRLSEFEQLAEDIIFLNEGMTVFAGSKKNLLQTTGASDLEQAITKLFCDTGV